MPQLFVGGSGRSGTTLMLKALGKHPEIHSLSMEMRFLIDPDGLVNLVNALSRDYSPFQAREALYRFHRLMTVHLCQPNRRPYLGFNFPAIFGEDFYSCRLNRFLDSMKAYEFEGRSYFEYHEENPEANRPVFGARYFPDRQVLLELTASFVDDLFSKAAEKAGKPIWCEKTPFNVLHLDFLWELFPRVPVIHIFRDPRAVILSLLQPTEYWAPDNAHDAALFLDSFFQRWFDLKARLDFTGKHLIEIRYEDLVRSPRPTLDRLKQELDLNRDFADIPSMNVARLDAWNEQLTPDQIRQVEAVMGPTIEKLGYPL